MPMLTDGAQYATDFQVLQLFLQFSCQLAEHRVVFFHDF